MDRSYEAGDPLGFLGEDLTDILLPYQREWGDEGASVSLRTSVIAIICKSGLMVRDAITEVGSLVAKAMIGS